MHCHFNAFSYTDIKFCPTQKLHGVTLSGVSFPYKYCVEVPHAGWPDFYTAWVFAQLLPEPHTSPGNKVQTDGLIHCSKQDSLSFICY